MAFVRFAPILRPSVGDVKQVQVEGETLAAILDSLYSSYPALKERIAPGGHLSRFLNIYINEQDSRQLQGLQTPIGSSDTILLLPAMAGGEGEHGLAKGLKPFRRDDVHHRYAGLCQW